jgi:WhiB family redox-sensing transcriptional regulator
MTMVPYVRDSGPIAGTRPSPRAGVARQSAGMQKTNTALDLDRWTGLGDCHPGIMGLFFGPDQERPRERERREKAAKKVCAGCPIRVRCLDFAQATGQKFGIYGGLNEEERAALAKASARAGGSS